VRRPVTNQDEERVRHCWAEGPRAERWEPGQVPVRLSSTCLLPAGHAGEHEFTPDDQIEVEFSDAPG